mgnify:FL=1
MIVKSYFKLIGLILILGSFNNSEQKSPEVNTSGDFVVLKVPDTVINISLIFYDNKISKWLKDGNNFSGYAIAKNQKGNLIKKFGILNGSSQNEWLEWFDNGALKSSTNFYKGKLHGEKKDWSSDSSHTLLSYLRYTNGKLNGEQKKWYPTGEINKILNFEMGKENGIQKAFRQNGVVFANYEAKNGRTFGLRKASLCYGLEDQKIKNNE